ncbi:mechanosensitive ion channel family protein [Aliikangiella sp. IMCC44653]
MDFLNVDKFWVLISEKLSLWFEATVKHLPNLVVAVLVAFVFALLARVLSSAIKRVLYRTLESRQIADLLTSIIKVILVSFGIFIALDFVGLKGTVTSLLAGAGIIGLALGFAFQDMTENLIAGIAMGIRKPFQINDIIKAGDVFGTVKKINLRNTLIETFYGQLEIVPNKILFRNVLTNFSSTQKRRIEIPVGISYADDPELAGKVIVESLNKQDFVIQKDETAVYSEGFGDSSINLLVWFWISYPEGIGFMEARHQAIVTIKKALDKADILIPFPIRTLDFDAKGGKTLDTMLKSRAEK